MPSKTKILWVGDDLRLDTGFGKINRNLLSRLCADERFEVVHQGWYYNRSNPAFNKPFPGNLKIFHTTLNKNDVCLKDDEFGQHSLYELISKERPQVVVTVADTFTLSHLPAIKERLPFTWVGYVPIDGEPLPTESYRQDTPFKWWDVLGKMDFIVCYGEFGQKTIKERHPEGNVNKISIGVDTDVFCPSGCGQEMRASMGLESDATLVGLFSRNQPRKGIPSALQAVSLLGDNRTYCPDCGSLVRGHYSRCPVWLRKGMPNQKICGGKNVLAQEHLDLNKLRLYLHMASHDVGWPLRDLVAEKGLAGKRVVMFNESLRIGCGCSEDKLNALYNACDISVLPSSGEGFGMTALESMAAGTPVVCSGYSGLTDFVSEEWGSLIPSYHNHAFTNEPLTNIRRFNIDEAMLVMGLERFILNDSDRFRSNWGIDRDIDVGREYRSRLSESAREKAISLSWDNVYSQWESLLVAATEKSLALKQSPWAHLIKA